MGDEEAVGVWDGGGTVYLTHAESPLVKGGAGGGRGERL